MDAAKDDWVGSLTGCRNWPHHEDRVAERVDEVEGPRTPFLVVRRPLHLDALPPLLVVPIRVIDFERNAGVAAMTRHRTIQSNGDGAALHAHQPRPIVITHLERDLEPKSIDVEAFGLCEIIDRENRNRSLHICFPRSLVAAVALESLLTFSPSCLL